MIRRKKTVVRKTVVRKTKVKRVQFQLPFSRAERLTHSAWFFSIKYAVLIQSCLALFLCGCGSVSGGITDATAPVSQDFEKTEIIANGSVAADGVSQLLLAIQLKNSDNSSVADYQPTYDVVSGAGVVSDCRET